MFTNMCSVRRTLEESIFQICQMLVKSWESDICFLKYLYTLFPSCPVKLEHVPNEQFQTLDTMQLCEFRTKALLLFSVTASQSNQKSVLILFLEASNWVSFHHLLFYTLTFRWLFGFFLFVSLNRQYFFYPSGYCLQFGIFLVLIIAKICLTFGMR